MVKCPSCGNTLDQDAGLVTCGQCNAVLMIDYNGNVHMGQEVALTSELTDDITSDETTTFENEEPTEDVVSVSEQTDPIVSSDFEDVMDNDIDDDLTEEPEVFEEITNSISVDDGVALSEPDEEIEDFQAADDFSDLDDLGTSENSFEEEEEDSVIEEEALAEDELSVQEEIFAEPEPEEVEEFSMASEPDPDPVDITGYANSEVSNLEEGELVYDVYLSRLDSKDLKDILKFVLLDEKLKLNHHEYLKKIKGGEVVIPNLNPLKAKRIVEQLQYTDIGVHWKQKRVVMETVKPDSLQETPDEGVDDVEL